VAPDVSVIGHTDTTGADTANAALGLQRASVIRDQLLQTGLDPALVEVVSFGESDLLVPTADNVAEARNRRVEVIVR
jgi:outer membrane protein OmpA-like peptidoglycan-associated protein